MGLSVYRGQRQAEQTAQNEFFTEFANSMRSLFELDGTDGILLGYPESVDNKFFQPDALLLTDNKILIIHFLGEAAQSYAAQKLDNVTITLPAEANFNDGRWLAQNPGDGAESGAEITAGKSLNPFALLEKQRLALLDILEDAGESLNVHTLALFQGAVTVEGPIPRRLAHRFSIADQNNSLAHLHEILQVPSTTSLKNMDNLRERFITSPDELLSAEQSTAIYQTESIQKLLDDQKRAATSENEEAERKERKRLTIWLVILGLAVLGLLIYGIISVLEMQKEIDEQVRGLVSTSHTSLIYSNSL